MKLRPYQEEAVDAVIDELFLMDRHSTLLVMATASGKTVTFSHVINAFLKNGSKTLVLAHRTELLEQAAEKIRMVAGLNPYEVQIEKASMYAEESSPVVCGSVMTMRGERLERWEPDHFGLIVIDEAHHAPAATYMDIIKHFSTAKIVGVTATPDRLDKKGLGKIFDSIAYAYEIADGVRDGYLSPIISKMVVIDSLDLSRVRVSRGDFVESDLERELITQPSLWEVVSPTITLSENRPTIVFGVTVEHARQLAEVFNVAKPGSSDYLSGADSEERRKDVLERFRRGEIQYLCNCLLFTEGVDLPFVSCVVCARPTQSRALYSQQVGRGMRICEGKENCLVIDFTSNASNHKLVCSLDIVDDNNDEEVRKRAVEKIKQGKMSPADALEESSNEIAEEAQELLRQEQLKAAVKEEVSWKVKEIDPLAVIGVHIREAKYGGVPPSKNQRDFLEKKGLWRDNLTNRQASQIIAKCIKRRNQGLCTPKQAMILMKHGMPVNVSFDDATYAIDRISQNGWKAPLGLLEHLSAREVVS